ncbi:MAG: recombination mediator RecR [Bacteroidales bacterium]|jgi:recombination protein RecR|nr:recombination mediator RecR [Bacteroidales bacterium]
MLNFYSKYLEDAVNEIAKLPGVGRRTALRLALFVAKNEEKEVLQLSEALLKLKSHLTVCQHCFNLSDDCICHICNNPKRDKSMVCVVQDIRDVIAIENTNQYTGVYHVLGGVISPMDGVGPNQLKLAELFQRIENEDIKELILALPATVEGDTTNFYIHKNVKVKVPVITLLSRGVGIGEELEYTDEVTLGRSLLARTEFERAYNRMQA